MKWTNSLLTKGFEPEERAQIERALAQDKVIVPMFLKLVNTKISSLEYVDIESVNWAIKRAIYDGQQKELRWLKSILEDD